MTSEIVCAILVLLIDTFHRLAIENPTLIRYKRKLKRERVTTGRLIADEAAGRFSD